MPAKAGACGSRAGAHVGGGIDAESLLHVDAKRFQEERLAAKTCSDFAAEAGHRSMSKNARHGPWDAQSLRVAAGVSMRDLLHWWRQQESLTEGHGEAFSGDRVGLKLEVSPRSAIFHGQCDAGCGWW